VTNGDVISVVVSTKGAVRDDDRAYAREKIAALSRLCREPVRSAQVRLVIEPDPARARPAVAEGALDIDGTSVRAHVAATKLSEAVDLLVERLRRRITRVEERRHGLPERRAAKNGESWRHGEAPAERPEYFPRPIDERELVRRKTFALQPMSIDEAALDLDLLGHDFYLFTEESTDADCALAYSDADGLVLHHRDDVAPDLTKVLAPVRLVAEPSDAVTLEDVRERLEIGHERFVYFVGEDTGRGQVLYHRIDGHYGLIVPQ
jgi:ribosome-associated translation inhibitor RaiA